MPEKSSVERGVGGGDRSRKSRGSDRRKIDSLLCSSKETEEGTQTIEKDFEGGVSGKVDVKDICSPIMSRRSIFDPTYTMG